MEFFVFFEETAVFWLIGLLWSVIRLQQVEERLLQDRLNLYNLSFFISLAGTFASIVAYLSH